MAAKEELVLHFDTRIMSGEAVWKRKEEVKLAQLITDSIERG